jgi:hypothetical protein
MPIQDIMRILGTGPSQKGRKKCVYGTLLMGDKIVVDVKYDQLSRVVYFYIMTSTIRTFREKF